MNKLLIPPSPNWYEADIMACSSDNTLIYGSRQDIIVIKSTPANEPDDVQVITKAHSMRIKSVSINRNWGLPHKYAVTVSEDKIVKLWDIDSLEKRSSHNKHILLDDNTKVVGASFAGDDRVVSTSESSTIVIWNLNKNETNVLSSLFDAKMTVTCLSVCPHTTWLAAFGFKNGLIAVADLRRDGKILYKMRGHDRAVVSLSWCPAPVNIFPVKPNNKVVEKSLEDNYESVNAEDQQASDANKNSERKVQNDPDNQEGSAIKEGLDNIEKEIVEPINQPLEISNEDKADRRKQKKPKKSPNPWVGLVHADDKESKELVENTNPPNDFLKECADLKQQIVQMSTPKNKDKVQVSDTESVFVHKRVILKPKIKGPKCNISDLLLKKEQALQFEVQDGGSGSVSEEKSEKETVETPTDRTVQNMEISLSLEKLQGKLTDLTEQSMDLTCMCDASKMNTTGSSEESKQFSSVGSCSNDCTCLKKPKEILEEVKKSDTSGTSESGDVFHDASVCEVKCEVREICKAEELATVEEQPRKEFLLASSAREPNIYIWRAGTDGRMQSFMTVPPIKNQKKARSDKLWITVCWVAPNILLSSSRGAELLEWTVPKKQTLQGRSFRTVHKDHWSVLFSIKAPILYLNEYNFLQGNKHISAWTTGMDRAIFNTDIRSQKNLGCYYALGGSVNCLSGSPLDPNRLAIGTGEGVLNVWDLSRQHTKRIVFSTFYQKIAAEVTALAWHPHIETSLALATIEGRILILDTVGKTKSPKLLPHYFKSQIFKMEWFPLNGDIQNPVLFVVGEAKVAIFDIKSRENEPQLLEMPDNTDVYTMSWKPDYSLLLVSSKSGSLISYTPDLKISQISYVRHKLESIVWNPNAASNDLSVSKYCRTFVSVVKRTDFVVYDWGVQTENHDEKVIARFENRGVMINSIEWNPHVGNQLVFVDDGGIAQIYDIETKSVLSTYVNSGLDPLLSAYWSPIDQDYVITGTTAHKIIVWKVSEHAPLTEKEINTVRNKLTKAQSNKGDQLTKLKLNEAFIQEAEGTKPKKSTKSNILPTFYSVNEKTIVQDMRKLMVWKLGDEIFEANVGADRYVDLLELFDEKNNMERVLNLNISSFRQKGQHQSGNLLSLFKGDIGTAVKEAIDQKRVNPWIISMCPMVSPKLWQTACETYADQLRDEPNADPLEIVTYLLACHKVEESVNVLCEREMFKEAFTLAKARFGAENSLVSEILEKWAKSLASHGNLEFAALCYISLGDFKNAATVLFRRSNADILDLAVGLATLSGDKELEKAVKFRFDAFKVVDKTEGAKAVDKTNKDNGLERAKEISEKNGNNQVSGEACTSEKSADSSCIIEETKVEKPEDTSRGQLGESKEHDCTETTVDLLDLKQNVDSNNTHKDADSDISTNNSKSPKESVEDKEKDLDNIKKRSEESKEFVEKDMTESDCHKSDSEKKELKSIMKELSDKVVKSQIPESGESKTFKTAIESDKDTIKEESNNVYNKTQDESEVKSDTVLNEKSASELKGTVTCVVEFKKTVQELLSDALMKNSIALDTVAQEVVKSQEFLLSTDEVKDWLSTRRMSSAGEDTVKEKKEE